MKCLDLSNKKTVEVKELIDVLLDEINYNTKELKDAKIFQDRDFYYSRVCTLITFGCLNLGLITQDQHKMMFDYTTELFIKGNKND